MPPDQPINLLSEDLPLAGELAAEEPAYLQLDLDRPSTRGQIPHGPPVPAVHAGRRQPTLRTRGLGRHRARCDQHRVTKVLNSKDLHILERRAEQTEAAGILACRRMQHN
jgi:hypothetical protein